MGYGEGLRVKMVGKVHEEEGWRGKGWGRCLERFERMW